MVPRVLVVEGESEERSALCAELERRGLPWKAVELVDDALHELCHAAPDVVVLELARPMAHVLLEVLADLRHGRRPIGVVVAASDPRGAHVTADAVVKCGCDVSEVLRAITFARDSATMRSDV